MTNTKVKGLIWDEWNKDHIALHDISTEEVEEVCHNADRSVATYRKRIQIMGKTKNGRILTIILSPEDRNLIHYGDGPYYPITAFEKEV